MKREKVSKISFKFWLPAIFWMGVIFYFSSKSDLTVGIGGVQEFIMRKLVHIVEFGFLAVLLLLLLVKGCDKKGRSAFFGALLLTVFYAFSDELHQTFVVGRCGNLKDVLIDSLGALLFLQSVALGFFPKKRRLLISSILLTLTALGLLLTGISQTVLVKQDFSQAATLDSAELSSEKQGLLLQEAVTQELLIAKAGQESVNNGDKKNSLEEQDNGLNLQKQQEEVAVRKKVILPVPFSSQAPFAIWDEVHEEACEEMSLIMVKYYFEQKKLSPQLAEDEIQKMKEYQLKRNGHYIDSDMQELAEIAREYFGLANASVKYDITQQDIIASLTQGSPVIVPTAGRMLENPNFSGLGPLYHNLVIVGFEGDEFITNDPGTRKGKHYRYKSKTIMEAIHDYPGNKNDIQKGKKAGIVFLD